MIAIMCRFYGLTFVIPAPFHRYVSMFPVVILQKLYVSLVCPQLTYGLLAWGSKCDLLVTQQKRCLRSSNGKSRTAHTEPLLKTMNQLKLVDM